MQFEKKEFRLSFSILNPIQKNWKDVASKNGEKIFFKQPFIFPWVKTQKRQDDWCSRQKKWKFTIKIFITC